MESLVNFGGAVKAKADGSIGGYLVRFSDEKSPDLDGDFFTKETDFGFTGTIKTAIYFNHRLPLKTSKGKTVQVKEQIGEATLSIDDEGVLIEDAVLFNRKRYEKLLESLGWSSGTAPYLVDTVKSGKANRIVKWPLGLDASLTPIPAQPYKTQVTSTKSIGESVIDEFEDDEDSDIIPNKPTALTAKLNQHIDDLADDKGRTRAQIIKSLAAEAGMDISAVESLLAGEEAATDARLKAFARVLDVSFNSLKATLRKDHLLTIKGMFEEALADRVPSRWELESIYCDVIRKLANAASGARIVGSEFDLEAKLSEATAEYTALLEKHALAQIQEWIADGADDEFYLKTIAKPSKDVLADVQIDLSDHSDLLVTGLKSVYTRFRGNHASRVKAGRVLSEKNRQRITDLITAMKGIIGDFQTLLDESQPMATEAAKRAAITQTLRNKWRSRHLGVTLNG